MYLEKNKSVIQSYFITLSTILCVGIFTSKAILNITLPLILISSIYIILTKQDNKTSRAFVYMFIIGLLLSLFSGDTARDKLYYIREYAFLFIPTLIFYSINKNGVNTIIKPIIVGFCISLIIFASKNIDVIFKWNGEGLTSQWDIGRWREIIIYFLCVSIPLSIYEKNKCYKLALITLTIAGLLSFVLSAGRAGYLVLAFILLPYIILRKWKVSIIAMLTLLIFTGLTSNNFYNHIFQRISSIANIETNTSNLGRIYMWDNAIRFLEHNYYNDKTTLLFGTGAYSFKKMNECFIQKNRNIETLKSETGNQFSINDPHNGFLNIIVKNGVLFSISFYLGIIFIIKKLISTKVDKTRDISLLCLASWLLQGVFYTNSTSYQAAMALTIISIGLFGACTNESEKNNED